VRAGLVLFIIYLCFGQTAYAEVVFSANYGLNQFLTKELNNKSGKAAGTSSTAKLGLLNAGTEIGIYNTNINSSVTLKHDGENSDASYKINSVGAYIAIYKKNAFFEFGYGKASISESLSTNLTGSSLSALKSIYNLNTDETFASTEARLLGGIKLFSLSLFTFVVYIQKIKMLETSHDETDLGLELKLNF
jgi:hypothetical protein